MGCACLGFGNLGSWPHRGLNSLWGPGYTHTNQYGHVVFGF